MTDFMIALVLIALVAGILRYLIRAKKRGESCIGCPHAKGCGSCHGGCSCGGSHE